MNMKKTLAGVMAVAMTATMLPGSMFAAPETVEARTVSSSLPEAKYEMDLEGNLNVTGDSVVSVATYAKAYSPYSGGAKYVSDRDGQVLDTEGAYGIKLENVQLGSTYTISAWVNLQSAVDNSPVISASNPERQDNWLTLAGGGTTQYKLWTDSNFAEWGGQSELERIPYKRNQWVNYVLSVDGNSAVLYEDGKSVIKGTNAGVEISSENKNITFGVNPWDDAVPDALYDDIKIYDKALSAEQVQALYSGTSLSLSTSQDYVRVGDTIELTADIIGMQDGDTVEWSSNGSASVDKNGVVTGSAEGTATITANVKRNGDSIATDTIDINVIPKKGNLIADFTFEEDDQPEQFDGKGAYAQKYGNYNRIQIVDDKEKGSVLEFTSEKGLSPDANGGGWLDIKKSDGGQLLDGVEEFTVSYDSNSAAYFANNWIFYANKMGGGTSGRHYLGIMDQSDRLGIERANYAFVQENPLATYNAGWKHVDVVFNEYRTDVYLNGSFVTSIDSSESVQNALQDDGFIWIGKSEYGNEYWKGRLDNYKIYDYALTAEEVMIEYRDLQHYPAVEATCTTDGNVEHWTDADGNYYLDAAGEIPTTADEVKVDATGHNYGRPTWEWIKSEDGSTYTAATATFICEKGDDTQQVTDEEVTHVIENGQVIYSAEVTFGEQSYETTTTASLVLTATEEVPATCTEAGTKAYWTDQFGNRYLDAEGQSSVTDDEELVIPATGHDYISSGRWTATEEGYSLDVTFTCKHGDDTATVPAKVTSSSSDGVTVYTAVAEHNGTQFTYTKEVQDSYALTVVDGTIEGTEVTTNNYGYNDVVTVVAEKMKDGQYFEGWYIGDTLVSGNPVYSFCIVEDKTLTARYSSEEAEERAVVSLRMSDREDIGSDAERVVMTVEWSVPSDYTMIGAGLVRSYTESSEDMLTLEHVDRSSIRQNQTKAWCKNGYYKYTLNMSPTTKLNPVNARGYLIYEDAEGAEYTIYTDVFVSPVTQ